MPRKRKRRNPKSVKERLTEWLDAGGDWKRKSYNEIAKEVDAANVYSQLHEVVARRENYASPAVVRDIRREYRAQKDQELDSRVSELSDSDMMPNDIAFQVKSSRSTVYRRLERLAKHRKKIDTRIKKVVKPTDKKGDK